MKKKGRVSEVIVSECDAYDRVNNERAKLPRPAVNAAQFMEGVDKAGMLISLYKTKCKMVSSHNFSTSYLPCSKSIGNLQRNWWK